MGEESIREQKKTNRRIKVYKFIAFTIVGLSIAFVAWIIIIIAEMPYIESYPPLTPPPFLSFLVNIFSSGYVAIAILIIAGLFAYFSKSADDEQERQRQRKRYRNAIIVLVLVWILACVSFVVWLISVEAPILEVLGRM